MAKLASAPPRKSSVDKNPTGKRELQRAADPVSARAALRETRPEHHERAAQKSARETFRHPGPEAPAPERRHTLLRAIVAQFRAREGADENADHQHPFPIDLRRLAFRLLLLEIGIGRLRARIDRLIEQRRGVLIGSGNPQRMVCGQENEPA